MHSSSVEQQSFALTWKKTPDLQILATCTSVFIYSSHVIIFIYFTISHTSLLPLSFHMKRYMNPVAQLMMIDLNLEQGKWPRCYAPSETATCL